METLKRLIDERYDGSSMRMGRELDLGQTVKNALADGHICKAYARLIELETGVDIAEHEPPSFDTMSTDEKIDFLMEKIDWLFSKVKRMETRSEDAQLDFLQNMTGAEYLETKKQIKGAE